MREAFELLPQALQRMFLLIRRLLAPPVVLTLALFIYFSNRPEGPKWPVETTFVGKNLRQICLQWLQLQKAGNNAETFIPSEFKQAISPGLSPGVEGKLINGRIAWNINAPLLRNYGTPMLIYLGCMLYLLRRRRNFWMIICVEFIVIFTPLVITAWVPHTTANLLWPKSWNYIDDFVYLQNIDWTVKGRARRSTIIAYEKVADRGYRHAGFLGGNISCVTDKEFANLLESQGHPLPANGAKTTNQP